LDSIWKSPLFRSIFCGTERLIPRANGKRNIRIMIMLFAGKQYDIVGAEMPNGET
jgi:hypothetical protein